MKGSIMSSYSRRQFLEDSMLAAAAAAAANIVPQRAEGQDPPVKSANETILHAVIGCRIRGRVHAKEFGGKPGVEIAYVCDPDRNLANELADAVAKERGKRPKAVQDLREVFDDKSVDTVSVAAPNHWHALAAIWAMQAGKDVYVEKPVSHNISEGRRMVQVARKTNRICQGGHQYRSSGSNAQAVEYMRQGKLGQVKLARSIVYGGRGSIGELGKYEVPSSVDYNLFQGPAPLVPLTRKNLHYDWHWVWDTGSGELGNNNVHSLDICRWGLGVTGLGRQVISYGGRFGYTDAGQTPNTQVCLFDFGDKMIISETRGLKTAPFHPERKGGTIFEGTEGIIAGSSVFDPQGKLISTFDGKSENHFANFLAAVRSRQREDQKAEILEGHQSAALCHIGNISWRLGKLASPTEIRSEVGKMKANEYVFDALDRTVQHLGDHKIDLEKTQIQLGRLLQIDGDKEAFANSPEANAMLTREYRKPFVVPSEKEIG
jgi:predicted dehydrogenase